MEVKGEMKIKGMVRLQKFKLSRKSLVFVKFLQLFNRGKLGAQTIGKFINNYVPKYGILLHDTGFEPNIITNVGKAQIALLAGDATATPFTYLAVGTSATAVAATDTTLTAEITDSGLARTVATVSRDSTGGVTNDTVVLTFTWTASGSKTVQEIGIFNASSVGTMLGHKLTGALPLVSGNVLIGTYKVSFA